MTDIKMKFYAHERLLQTNNFCYFTKLNRSKIAIYGSFLDVLKTTHRLKKALLLK
jgi:hypothetical protein